jgi:hypothetical protein
MRKFQTEIVTTFYHDERVWKTECAGHKNGRDFILKFIKQILIVVFPCMLIITQLLFQQNALVFIKITRYYNLYFLSLYF